ncbi:DNA polymerase III subunit delta' [Suttonella ornithocola]|uniref:DNA-directed DNA polymerase n=1 Tax=Suttonella ornithocola TaxID=279832 RepID=A0A380N0A5_9GAMM|nr:DNA polymerase III subunit delta' [Suttonella ornithocola]SUO97958.1 DNA polymerase III subunit delta' [Suttonella ornithocola]
MKKTYPWTTLPAPLLPLTKKPINCLLLIDPQKENAKALAYQYQLTTLCQQTIDDKPCGHCQACHLIAQEIHPDTLYYEAPLKTAEVRELITKISKTPVLNDYRLIYLADIDHYNDYALNALLKTLEEPPSHSHFILSASTRRAVKPTILSRSRIINVLQPNTQQALNWLVNQDIEPSKAQVLLSLFHNNPFQAVALKDKPEPLQILPDLAQYCAFPQKTLKFLQQLDQYDEKDKLHLLILNLETLISIIQLDTYPQNWHNPHIDKELIKTIDPYRLHSLYAALCRLRLPNQIQINTSATIRSLLLTQLDNRNLIL